MTKFESLTIFIQVVTAICVIIGIVYTAIQLRLLRKIHQDNNKWNRQIAAKEAVRGSRIYESRKILNRELDYINKKEPIPLAEIFDKFEKNSDLEVHCISVLNFFEGLSNGVILGIYDELVVEAAWKGYMILTYNVFSNYIKYRNTEIKDAPFRNFETLAYKWGYRDIKQ